MTHSFTRRAGALAMVGFAAATVVGLLPAQRRQLDPGRLGAPRAPPTRQTATSAEAFGGMDALVRPPRRRARSTSSRCRRTGPTTARSSRRFEAKYRASRSTSDQPDGSSADEITAAKRLKGQSGAPDVFDLGAAVALANTDDVRAVPGRRPGRTSAPTSRSRTACGSTTTAATCRSATTPPRCPRRPPSPTCSRPTYKGKVALNGDPTEAGAAFAGVRDGGGRQRRDRRRHHQGRRLLQQAEEGRQLPAGRPDPGHDRVRPDPGRHRLGLPQRRRDGQARRPGRSIVPEGGRHRRLLLPGDQRRRPAPGRRAAVAGVPVLRRGPEPVAQGRRPAGPRRGDEARRARSTRRQPPRCRRSTARRSCRPRPDRRSPARPTWQPTGPRPLAERRRAGRRHSSRHRPSSRPPGRRPRSSPTRRSSC